VQHPPRPSISTAFFLIGQDSNVADFIAALGDLPIDGVELEYRIPAPVVPALRSSLRRIGVPVTSVHNFFPLPLDHLKTGGGGDLFSLSDTRRDEREEAVKRTLQTIDQAHDLEAQAVVLHCGQVSMAAETRGLYHRFREEGLLSEASRQWLLNKVKERDRRKPAHLDALCFSLEKLIRAADGRHVRLGLENRYHYHELPGPDDFQFLLQKFDGAPLGYWHDTGHAHANEQLGLVAEGDLLKNLSDRLVGIHLHDADGLDDHLPPGQGRIDFQTLAPHMTSGVPVVLELRPGTPLDAVQSGLDYLTARLHE